MSKVRGPGVEAVYSYMFCQPVHRHLNCCIMPSGSVVILLPSVCNLLLNPEKYLSIFHVFMHTSRQESIQSTFQIGGREVNMHAYIGGSGGYFLVSVWLKTAVHARIWLAHCI